MPEPLPPSTPWRVLSAVLSAWCVFWGTLMAITSVFRSAILLADVEVGEPVPAFWALRVLAGSAMAVFVTGWQWRRMARAPSGDHGRLALVLLIVGITVAPAPFVYTTF